MALKGNLRDFSITQLLNLVNLAQKSGALQVEGPGETAQVYFREGKLSYAQIGSEDSSLASVLQRNRKITTGQYQILKARAAQMSDKELGLFLVNAGYVTQDDVLTSLQVYTAEVVRRLFTWVEGFFRFDPDQTTPEDKIPVRVDLENLIIEGSRQLREWEQLQDEIPSLEMALRFTERPGSSIQKLNLSVEEWRVISFVNPRNTMQQIAQHAKMSDVEIRRVVFSLLQAGVVEIVRPGGGPPLPHGRMFPTANREEQRSLVNRLIDRIRSI